MKFRSRYVDRDRVNPNAALEQTRASRMGAITIFTVLMLSSISGAVFAQFTGADSVPDSIGQFDTGLWDVDTVESPDSMAFRSE